MIITIHGSIGPSTHRELGQAIAAAMRRTAPPSRWVRFMTWLRSWA